MRTRVAAIHVGQNTRGNQVAEPDASCPGVLKFLGRADADERVLERTSEAAELTIAKEANNPIAVELPVITETHRSKPAGATLALVDSEGQATDRIHDVLVSRPQAATATTEDVEASPARRRGRRRSLDIGPSSKIGGRRCCGQCTKRSQRQKNLFHAPDLQR